MEKGQDDRMTTGTRTGASAPAVVKRREKVLTRNMLVRARDREVKTDLSSAEDDSEAAIEALRKYRND